MSGGIKRIGSNGARAQNINSPVATVPSRQGLLKINNLNTPNISDWTEYTPTMTNLGNGTVTARYRRVGDSIDIICKVVAGSTTSATAVTFTLPSGLSADLAKMANYNSGALGDVWTSNATYRDVGNNTRSIICRYEGSNEFRFVHFFANGTGAANAIVYDNSSLPQFNAGDIIIAWITNFPIQGWSANNNATIEEIVESSFFDLQFKKMYPVGSIYFNASFNLNPSELLGFGVWQSFGAGRVLVGFDSSDPLFDAIEETGGSKDAVVVSHNHTITGTAASNGSHTHDILSGTDTSDFGPKGRGAGTTSTSGTIVTDSAGAHTHSVSGSTNTVGESATNANLQPYITVYMWKRVA